MSTKSISLATAIIRVKALGEGTKFYASDLGLAGGTISGLNINGYIKKTGNTKICMVNIYDNHYIKAEIFEWEVCGEEDTNSLWKEYKDKEFERMAEKILAAAEALKVLGF